jgi:thioredoxin 1
MLEPTIAAIAEKTDAAVVKVDIDEHQGLAAQYGVRGVPTLLLFADGEQVEQVVGVQDEAKLTSLVERHT